MDRIRRLENERRRRRLARVAKEAEQMAAEIRNSPTYAELQVMKKDRSKASPPAPIPVDKMTNKQLLAKAAQDRVNKQWES